MAAVDLGRNRILPHVSAATVVSRVQDSSNMKKILGIATLAALQACFTPAAAQSADSWPNRPVRIIHGFAPAGPIDNFARLLAAQFNDRFGEPAIVEGKPLPRVSSRAVRRTDTSFT
jgi:hypothetical protein